MIYENTKKYEIIVNFENIKKSFVYLHKNENIITGSNTIIDNNNISNYVSNQFAHLKLHDNSRIFLRATSTINETLYKDIIKLPFKKNIDINLTVIPFEKENKIRLGWYNFIENTNKEVSLTGTLFYSFDRIPELLDYFISPMNVTLFLTKLDKRKVKIDIFPFSKFPKTYYEDKQLFYLK